MAEPSTLPTANAEKKAFDSSKKDAAHAAVSLTMTARSASTRDGAGEEVAGQDAPTSKLAQSQARRLRRVLDAAGKLADQGGFEGVRLRDVAEASGVALGTLYRYFDSKEAILIHTIAEDLTALEERFRKEPIRAASALERVMEFFSLIAHQQALRPHYVRAALRAVSFAGGETHALPQVAAFHLRMTSMILAALRGEAPRAHTELALDEKAENQEARVECEQAALLELIWFGLLVTWAGNLCEIDRILQKLRVAAQLILREEGSPTEKSTSRG